MEATMNLSKSQEAKGFYKLSMLQCIGFGSGDLAQNLIYQTISMYLLFFYTNVYGLDPAVAAVMFLIVRIVDVIWDPLVGTFVDKHDPKLGKYRAYLVLGGIPLTAFAILCFWNGFSGSLLYAYVTYVGLSMCYTLVNVPYGALNASLTRDTAEITKLTSVRMFMANVGGLAVGMGIPIVLKMFDPSETSDMSMSDGAWFATMAIYGCVGLALLFFCFSQCRERVVMAKEETENVKVSDLWMEFVHNRPLRILAFFFITAFAMMAVGNAAGAYYINYNLTRLGRGALYLHGAWLDSGFHIHAYDSGYQEDGWKEGYVLHFPRHSHCRHGHALCHFGHRCFETAHMACLCGTIRQINRRDRGYRLHVGTCPRGDIIR